LSWNLLSNAIKFTPEGGSVRVRVERTETTIRLSVERHGRRYQARFLPFIFEPFPAGRWSDGETT
jgi:signal transduction histidine kinase